MVSILVKIPCGKVLLWPLSVGVAAIIGIDNDVDEDDGDDDDDDDDDEDDDDRDDDDDVMDSKYV